MDARQMHKTPQQAPCESNPIKEHKFLPKSRNNKIWLFEGE
jgi:hypothetical protein